MGSRMMSGIGLGCFFFFYQGWFILEVKGGDGTQGENWIGVSKAAPPKVKTSKD